MPTRTFISMIFLMVLLLLASSPAMLEQMAGGIEHVGTKAGAPGFTAEADAARAAKAEAKAAKDDDDPAAAKDDEQPLAQLEVKGYALDAKTGDLRDGYSELERSYNHGGRLPDGLSRRALPGQEPGTDAYTAPWQGGEGLLLDSTGCPRFPEGIDVASLLTDPKVLSAYEGKVAAADEPAACRVTFAARREQATTETAFELPGDARTIAALQRGGIESPAIYLAYVDLLGEMLDLQAADDFVAELGNGARLGAVAEEPAAAAGGDAAEATG